MFELDSLTMFDFLNASRSQEIGTVRQKYNGVEEEDEEEEEEEVVEIAIDGEEGHASTSPRICELGKQTFNIVNTYNKFDTGSAKDGGRVSECRPVPYSDGIVISSRVSLGTVSTPPMSPLSEDGGATGGTELELPTWQCSVSKMAGSSSSSNVVFSGKASGKANSGPALSSVSQKAAVCKVVHRQAPSESALDQSIDANNHTNQLSFFSLWWSHRCAQQQLSTKTGSYIAFVPGGNFVLYGIVLIFILIVIEKVILS
jgi:hypothetical protein